MAWKAPSDKLYIQRWKIETTKNETEWHQMKRQNKTEERRSKKHGHSKHIFRTVFVRATPKCLSFLVRYIQHKFVAANEHNRIYRRHESERLHWSRINGQTTHTPTTAPRKAHKHEPIVKPNKCGGVINMWNIMHFVAFFRVLFFQWLSVLRVISCYNCRLCRTGYSYHMRCKHHWANTTHKNRNNIRMTF